MGHRTIPLRGMTHRGAYGFRIEGVGSAERLLATVPADAPRLSLVQELDDRPAPAPSIDASSAIVGLLPAGWLELDRAVATAKYHVPAPIGTEALVHPYLAPAAAIAAVWQGWDPYHAAGVVIDDGVWAISGEREAGKSTLVAALAARGHTVMADDLLVVRDEDVLAGPRTIDLRDDHAGRFGATRSLGVTGMRARWRIDLPPPPPAARLRGWIYPGWADATSIEPLPLASRVALPQLQRAATFTSPRPEHALWLARLPALRFSRKRDWNDLDTGIDALLEALREVGGQSASSNE
jgi:hypothetical protein